MKFCKDCKHYMKGAHPEDDRCKVGAPPSAYAGLHLVRGEDRAAESFQRCTIERGPYADVCGPDGRNFEAAS